MFHCLFIDSSLGFTWPNITVIFQKFFKGVPLTPCWQAASWSGTGTFLPQLQISLRMIKATLHIVGTWTDFWQFRTYFCSNNHSHTALRVLRRPTDFRTVSVTQLQYLNTSHPNILQSRTVFCPLQCYCNDYIYKCTIKHVCCY